ncbi:hypothetical protein [Shimia sagamensis]|uniref:DUF4405 domain-containing protein n=1 Tax=Shimia sagamensis TaxID=1566352 RepID=A0ABY1P2K5_9RHOB|nr:hypothetical protein [Shimia sagamensis]SMP23873.1 hypothetical protein SAMN06265373_104451 [Shimia sagamensis]
MRVLISTWQRAPYVLIILIALGLGMILLSSEAKSVLAKPLTGFSQQVATGLLLLGLLGYQWVLFFKRVTKDNRNARQAVVRHRWVGTAATLLFAIHAVRFGHVWMSTLSAVVFLVALTGVLNREVLRYRSNMIYLVWLLVHIGLSAALVPLVAVHIWVALAYQ